MSDQVPAPAEALDVVHERDGRVLDTVTLTGDGRLRYQTGVARPLFESVRDRDDTLTDSQLFAFGAGWSNGYVTVRRRGGESSTPDDPEGPE